MPQKIQKINNFGFYRLEIPAPIRNWNGAFNLQPLF